MVYNQKMVTAVKCDGKIMREHGETVYLPYGKEYSIFLKNLSGKRASVKVEIDGVDVLDGSLIMDSNQSIDLERFILNGDMSRGPKFKYIEKTQQISNVRGNRIEDGLIRVSYQFEKLTYDEPSIKKWFIGSPSIPPYYDRYDNLRMSIGDGIVYGSCLRNNNPFIRTSSLMSDQGITTYGNESTQSFKYGSIGTLEDEVHVIVLQLKGDIGQVPVEKPLTVNRKVKCGICGNINTSIMKFCGNCGTNLSY